MRTQNKLPEFKDEHTEWINNALYYHKQVSTCVHVFLMVFDEFLHPDYGTPYEIEEMLCDKISDIRRNMSFTSKGRKIAEQAIIKNLSLYFPYTDPIRRIALYHQMIYSNNLSPSGKLSVLKEIGREVQEMKQEKTPLFPLPDLS